MKRIKIVIVLGLIICLFGFTGISFSADYMFTVGTAGAGGTFNYIGSALSNYLSKNIDNMTLRAITTGGSNTNIRLLKDGDVDLALAMGLALNAAYEGTGIWEGKPQKNLRAITRTHASTIHYVVRKDSGVKSLKDLRGVKGNTDVVGAATTQYHKSVFKFVGVDVDDIPVEHVNYHEAVQLLRDGHIKWFLAGGTVPEANVMEIATTRDIDILDIGGELRENILKEFPYYFSRTIPGGTYKGIDRDVETIEAIAVLFVDVSQSEDVVYEITKAIFENIDEIGELHIGLDSLSLDNAAGGLGIPLHPGAEKYYREVGKIK